MLYHYMQAIGAGAKVQDVRLTVPNIQTGTHLNKKNESTESSPLTITMNVHRFKTSGITLPAFSVKYSNHNMYTTSGITIPAFSVKHQQHQLHVPCYDSNHKKEKKKTAKPSTQQNFKRVNHLIYVWYVEGPNDTDLLYLLETTDKAYTNAVQIHTQRTRKNAPR